MILVGNFLKDHVIPRSATAAAVIWKMKHNERLDSTVIDRAIHCMDNAFCLWAHINALLLLSKICFIKTAAVATIILDADVVVVVTAWFSTNFVQSSRDAEANVPHAQKLSRIKTFLTAIFRLIHDTKCQVLFGG